MDSLLILSGGLATTWACRRLGWPAAVVQVVLGILLGAAVLGWVQPTPALELLGEIGVVLLLGVAGLELGTGSLRAAGWAAFWVATLGIVLSGIAGYFVASAVGMGIEEAIYTGLALTATSVGISVQTLRQFGLSSHRIGKVVVAAAVIDDVLALFLLAAAHGVVGGELKTAMVLGVAILAVPLIGGIALLSATLARAVANLLGDERDFRLTLIAVFAILFSGWLTHALGYSAVVGGFFAGLGLSTALAPRARQHHATRLAPMVLLLTPFFFVLIGTRANFEVIGDPGIPALLGGLVAAAVGGKLIGSVLGAGRGELSARLLIGLAMVPRGEVTMVIAGIGLTQRHLSHHTFVTLLLVSIVAAVAAPILMTPLARRIRSQGDLNSP